MARRPAKANPERPRRTAARPAAPEPPVTDRDKIVAAFMALIAERPIEAISFSDVAARAGVSLAALRGEFGSKLAILAAFLKEIDRQVLAGGDPELAEEPPRERLFDVLMRRIEALTPHRDAVASLVRSARRRPGFALVLNRLAVNSQQWMLAAANIPGAGPRGRLRAQGLALLYARVLRTFLEDDDPGLARTMAALDRALARGQRLAGLLDEVCLFAPHRMLCRLRRHRRSHDEDRDFGEEHAVV
jgi:AcrR family transcriptional regulator